MVKYSKSQILTRFTHLNTQMVRYSNVQMVKYLNGNFQMLKSSKIKKMKCSKNLSHPNFISVKVPQPIFDPSINSFEITCLKICENSSNSIRLEAKWIIQAQLNFLFYNEIIKPKN